MTLGLKARAWVLVAATWPVVPQGPPPAATEKPSVVAEEAPSVTESPKATIHIYRPRKYFGRALEPDMFCDEKKVVDMDSGRYFTLKVAPGTHVIRSSLKRSSIEQHFEAGSVYYFRFRLAAGFSLWWHGELTPVSETEALAAMRKLKPLGKNKVEASAGPIVVLETVQ